MATLLLDVKGREDLPEEQLGVEHLLVFKLLVPNAFDAPVSSHKLTLAPHLFPEGLDVLSLEQVAGLGAAVAEVDLVSEAAHCVEQLLCPRIAPVLGVPSVLVDAQRYGVEGVLWRTVLALVLSLSVVQERVDETSRSLGHATDDQRLVLMLSQYSQL